jgi:hypothetical protein
MEFKRYNKMIKVNDLDVAIDVVVTVSDESEYLNEFLDTYEYADRELMIQKVESGELFPGTITVEAKAFDLIGFDSLGACELKPNNMFNSEPYNTSVEGYVAEYSMEENAIAELVKQLETEYERAVVETEQEYTIKLVRAQGFKAFAK